MTAEQTQLAAKIRNSAWKDYLREPRWCGWKKGNPKPDGDGYAKIPMTVKDGKPDGASHAEPSDWMTFDQLCEVMLPGWGFGYQFLHGVLHPLDLDHVRNANTGLIVNEAMLLLSRLNTFSEISVSGRGIHCIFRGNVRGKQLGETCVQYWSPKSAPRFFTVTGELVGEAFSEIRDLGDDFNLVFATAAHTSAKMREELQAIDPEQFAKLPAEPVRKTTEPREKAKTKTRKVVDGFDIKDFLQFYGLGIDNEADKDVGHCIRLTTCPIKGAPHVGQNETSTNFIYPTTDGGLGFKCYSTGCEQSSVHDAIKSLTEAQGPYPKKIYEDKGKAEPRKLFLSRGPMSALVYKAPQWVKRHVLLAGALNLYVGDPDIGKTLKAISDMAELSREGKKTLVICREDDYASVWKPRLIVARADLDLIIPVHHVGVEGSDEKLPWMLNDASHLELFKETLLEEKAALCLIDPIADFMGNLKLNDGGDVRKITGLLAPIAQETGCGILANCHTTKAVVDSAIKSAAGSYQLMAAVQVSWLFMKDPDKPGQNLMLQGRNKHGKKRGFKYTIESKPWPGECPLDDPADGEDGVGCVEMKGEETRTADELLERHQDKDNGVKTRIRRWLNEMLANGPVSTENAGKEMSARDFNASTVRDVCHEMKIERDGKTWSMKKKEKQAVQKEFDLDGV